jgi:hypothetical protein
MGPGGSHNRSERHGKGNILVITEAQTPISRSPSPLLVPILTALCSINNLLYITVKEGENLVICDIWQYFSVRKNIPSSKANLDMGSVNEEISYVSKIYSLWTLHISEQSYLMSTTE